MGQCYKPMLKPKGGRVWKCFNPWDFNNGMEFITLFPNGENRNHITAEGAKRLLGTKEFLSGVSRSTFHSTAIRENNKKQLYFHYKWW